MASMVEIICKCGCGKKKMVRTADVKRGWGLFYSKSCKAREQERRTKQYAQYKRGERTSSVRTTDLATHYVENKARTNNLDCSQCGESIKKGSSVVFELADMEMINAFCWECGEDYQDYVIMDSEHIFSSEALGQD